MYYIEGFPFVSLIYPDIPGHYIAVFKYFGELMESLSQEFIVNSDKTIDIITDLY